MSTELKDKIKENLKLINLTESQFIERYVIL